MNEQAVTDLSASVHVERPSAGVAVVVFRGEHDLTTESEAADVLLSLVDSEQEVIADFSEAEFVDLAILRVLRRANRVAAQRGTRFSLQLGTASIVERLFEVSRVKEELRCFPDEGSSAVRRLWRALAAHDSELGSSPDRLPTHVLVDKTITS